PVTRGVHIIREVQAFCHPDEEVLEVTVLLMFILLCRGHDHMHRQILESSVIPPRKWNGRR
ncbi:Hypothetical protein FKW44_022279, partial [Caligus rogercresseyi]